MNVNGKKIVAESMVVLTLTLAGCYREPDASVANRPPVTRVKLTDPTANASSEDGTDSLLPPAWVVSYREGVRLLQAGEYEASVKQLDEAIELAPKFGLGYINRAVARRGMGDYEGSLVDIRNGKEQDPSGLAGYWPLLYEAEILATCSQSNLRDGKRAVELADQACEKTQWNHSLALAILAEAYAEMGDFEKAIHWQEKANTALATMENLATHAKEKLAKEMAERLELYKKGQPCRTLFPDPYALNRKE
jgi:tetratricopeptide (TPR) repeat protein